MDLRQVTMKKIKSTILSVAVAALCPAVLTGCGDYLEIIPENNLAVDNFWASKSDVASALNSGYYYLRASVEEKLIPWGEQRAGVIYGRSMGANVLQNFQIKSTSGICSWADMYKIINQANLVLQNAGKAQGNDPTYTTEEVNSHYCEAYFLRALAYFYIVRNWRDAPLVTVPYETDETPLQIEKSQESVLIQQIQSDLTAAMRLGAAKDLWDTTWETKGKATKWSIYALMADVCLWNSQFDEAIKYCDMILEDKSGNAPALITSPRTHTGWFAIFNPGNSKESIFEVQWNQEKADGSGTQQNTLYDRFAGLESGSYYISQQAMTEFREDYEYQKTAFRVFAEPENACRTLHGSYSGDDGRVWKYIGGSSLLEERTAAARDVNFIIYRVADIMLMKAEALVMRGKGLVAADNAEAISLINAIRERSNCEAVTADGTEPVTTLMDYIVRERVMELLAEGKIWYDLLRISRYTGIDGFDAKSYATNKVVYYSATNQNASESWIKNVLLNENAWFLPVYESEMKNNGKLVQNPYYQ